MALTLEACGSRGGQRFEIVGQQGDVRVHDWAPLVQGGESYLEETKARALEVVITH